MALGLYADEVFLLPSTVRFSAVVYGSWAVRDAPKVNPKIWSHNASWHCMNVPLLHPVARIWKKTGAA